VDGKTKTESFKKNKLLNSLNGMEEQKKLQLVLAPSLEKLFF
jgi:hypothetical protein